MKTYNLYNRISAFIKGLLFGNDSVRVEQTIYFEHPDLVKFLTEKGNEITLGREIQKEIEELQEKQNKHALRAQKFTEKIVPLVKELVKGQLGEYETVSTIELKDGKVAVNTYDVVEEFKAIYNEKKNK
jgi:hypothetical protein